MARDDRERLRKVVDRLCLEFEPSTDEGWLAAAAPSSFRRPERTPAPTRAESEDEAFVEDVRRSLARLAAAAGAGSLPQERRQMVRAALDGAELVTRGQLMIGDSEQLRLLLPSFVFLIALPIVQQDRALAIARRAQELADASI